MTILWTLIIGLIAGALAKFIMPGKDPGGIIITILLGVGGAVVANLLGGFLGIYQQGNSVGLIGATIGAIIILALYRLYRKRKAA